jgi:phosphoserine phosphatase
LCTEPVTDAAGILTGDVIRPMIGTAKADAVRDTMMQLGLTPADCYAYADHSSDLDMLTQVGHPRVVGADPVLNRHAKQHGWPILAMDGCPADHP